MKLALSRLLTFNNWSKKQMKIKIKNKILEAKSIDDLSYLVANEIREVLSANYQMNTTERLALKSVLQSLQAFENDHIENKDNHEFYCNAGVFEFQLAQEKNEDGLIESESLDLWVRGINEPKYLLGIYFSAGVYVFVDEYLHFLKD